MMGRQALVCLFALVLAPAAAFTRSPSSRRSMAAPSLRTVGKVMSGATKSAPPAKERYLYELADKSAEWGSTSVEERVTVAKELLERIESAPWDSSTAWLQNQVELELGAPGQVESSPKMVRDRASSVSVDHHHTPHPPPSQSMLPRI